MRLARLLHMRPDEIADRTRQMLRQWIERVHEPRAVRDDEVARVVAGIQRGERHRFAAPLDDATPRFVRDAMPDEARRLRAAARDLAAGRFRVLGYRGLSFGEPIDWRLDAVSGRRAPMLHWSRLDPLDAESVGDVKVTWELARHQWIVTLAQASALDRDDRLAERALAALEAWLDDNPVGYGIHWTSSLECAMRLVSWSWAIGLLRSSNALSPARLARLVRGLAAHADHVEHYLSTYFSPNTHLTGEALGLVYAGALLDGVDAAPRWRRLGAEILAGELRRQVLDDGVHFEQSTCYQRYTVEIYLHWRLFGGPADPAVERMLDFLLWLRRPDGTLPAIGDGDGGSLLPLSPRASGDARAVFSTAAVVFRRADYAWAAGRLAPETIWQLGPSAAEAFAALPAAPPDAAPSRVFAAGGWAVLRDSWADDAHQVVFDVGPLGCPVSSGHGHADLLAVQASVFGEPLLVDPGTFGYAAGPVRDAFRSSLVHSTLTVAGRSQAEPDGPFAWKSRPRAHLERAISRPSFELVTASHAAYGAVHRRSVIFAHGRVVIVDRVTGDGELPIQLRFQLAPGARVTRRGDWLRVIGRRGHALDLRPFAAVALAPRIHDGWFCADYGRRVPAPLVVFEAVARLPFTTVTLLVPRPCVESQAS